MKKDESNGFEIVKGGGVCAPLGFSASACAADIRGKGKKKLDLALLVSDTPCQTAALFTTNRVLAAPVRYNKGLFEKTKEFYGTIVNSDCANACTGAEGYKNSEKTASLAEKKLGFSDGSLLVASTGVIGAQLPIDKISANIPELCDGLDDSNGNLFAKAIMTTDTEVKEIAALVNTDNGSYVIGGACKGAGMIDPSMATLLCFITTDMALCAEELQNLLKEAAEESFNSITIDGDMSTNDTLIAFANGMSGVSLADGRHREQFYAAFKWVCKQLALMVVKDGEGATKLITIEITGAKSDTEAKKCALKIANSPLVKTMLSGCDPNWGRILASAGASGAEFDPDKVSVWFGDLLYVKNSLIIDLKLEEKAYEIMKQPKYAIKVDLGAGDSEYVCHTCDMTMDYVKINADYRS
ncbi:MAG: bifunctional glutamate N-acetyltransferase/amino-acid acetyltransferase ArgJ [Deferribacteraceae bacterium]|jgi:glutamate N-acetyltransferase/amino-acid N-acetyltransferase|nr:bifunctional glutamate N-acetyltransferase/amino-acid acetyltransferase ArgJ [Deferribacteraceae bacterium]